MLKRGRRSARLTWRSGGTAGAIAAAVLGLAACDTTAELTFRENRLAGVHMAGLVGSNPEACKSGTTDETFRVRLGLQGTRTEAIRPGEVIGGDPVRVDGNNPTLSLSEDIEWFQTSTLVFAEPEREFLCNTDADCTSNPRLAGSTETWTCEFVNSSVQGSSPRVCAVRDVQLANVPGTLVYDEGDSDKKRIFILMANQSTLRGRLNPTSNRFDSTLGSDPTSVRVSGLTKFSQALERLQWGPKTEVCVATYAGRGVAAAVLPFPNDTEARCKFYDHDPEGRDSNDFRKEIATLSTKVDVSKSERGVWSAAISSLRDGLFSDQEAGSGPDGHMIVFVDGPDDASDPSLYNADRLIEVAEEKGVQIHFVHLETEVPSRPEYRSGPNAEYARVACATGGTYQYAAAPQDLEAAFETLARVVPESYQFDVELSAFTRFPALRYRMSSQLGVTLGKDSPSRLISGWTPNPLNNLPTGSALRRDNTLDNRLTIMRRPLAAGDDGTTVSEGSN